MLNTRKYHQDKPGVKSQKLRCKKTGKVYKLYDRYTMPHSNEGEVIRLQEIWGTFDPNDFEIIEFTGESK